MKRYDWNCLDAGRLQLQVREVTPVVRQERQFRRAKFTIRKVRSHYRRELPRQLLRTIRQQRSRRRTSGRFPKCELYV